jgi:hypothetical protein
VPGGRVIRERGTRSFSSSSPYPPAKLLELVSYPPAEGDDLEYLTRTLEEQRPHVEAAVDDLVRDGLAERDGARVRASAAAWRFDALWPARA